MRVWHEAGAAFLREFGGLRVEQQGAGVELARNSVRFDPLAARDALKSLAVFGAAIGAAVTPVGIVENGSFVVIDDRSRLFLIDHTGEWHLGDCPAGALTVLLDGKLPARVSEDGTWIPPV
jgi:hypothetical protein